MPVRLNGATSGAVTLSAPAVAGSASLILPTDSVQPGMVLVATSSFTTAATVSVDNCFTSTYSNYRIVVDTTSSAAAADLQFRVRGSGSDVSTSTYAYGVGRSSASAILFQGGSGSATFIYIGAMVNTSGDNTMVSIDITRPALAAKTQISFLASGYSQFVWYGFGANSNATAYDGFSLVPSTGTITGTVRIYAYRDSITT